MNGGLLVSDHENTLAFYRMRLEQELTLAAKANSSEIKEIHLQMAENYRQLIDDRGASGRPGQETHARTA